MAQEKTAEDILKEIKGSDDEASSDEEEIDLSKLK